KAALVDLLVLLKYPTFETMLKLIEAPSTAPKSVHLRSKMKEANDFRLLLQKKSIAELERMKVLGTTLTIDQAAELIAEIILPEDGYPQTAAQRQQCCDEYREV